MNASNLLDIGHALEALNITQEQRATLEAGIDDALGTILTKIVDVLNNKIDDVNTSMNKKGNCSIQYGSYVGNGQVGSTTPIRLTFNFAPKLFLCIDGSVNPSSGGGWMDSTVYLDRPDYSVSVYDSNIGNFNTIYFTQTDKTLSWWSNTAGAQLNISGTTYYYVALG